MRWISFSPWRDNIAWRVTSNLYYALSHAGVELLKSDVACQISAEGRLWFVIFHWWRLNSGQNVYQKRIVLTLTCSGMRLAAL